MQLQQGGGEALADARRRGRVVWVRGLEIVADHGALLPPPLRVAPLLALCKGRQGFAQFVLPSRATLLRGLLEPDGGHADPAHVGRDARLELLERGLQVGERDALVRQHRAHLGRRGGG